MTDQAEGLLLHEPIYYSLFPLHGGHASVLARLRFARANGNVPGDIGLLRFAPQRPARGPMFSARDRARLGGAPTIASPVVEAEFYGDAPVAARSDT